MKDEKRKNAEILSVWTERNEFELWMHNQCLLLSFVFCGTRKFRITKRLKELYYPAGELKRARSISKCGTIRATCTNGPPNSSTTTMTRAKDPEHAETEANYSKLLLNTKIDRNKPQKTVNTLSDASPRTSIFHVKLSRDGSMEEFHVIKPRKYQWTGRISKKRN